MNIEFEHLSQYIRILSIYANIYATISTQLMLMLLMLMLMLMLHNVPRLERLLFGFASDILSNYKD